MKRQLRILARIMVFLLSLIAAPTFAAGHLDRYPAFTSRYVIARDITVWTPDSYDPKGPPVAVLYMQDGENLYDSTHSLSGANWGVDVTASRLIREGKTPPFIVVGIASTALRGREYLPQKVFDHLPARTRAAFAKGWGGAPLSDAYLKFIVRELKPFVDSQYHTQTGAAHTFVAGSSMGGLISFYAQAEYPQVFGGSASLSMHWLLANPWIPMPDDAMNAPQVLHAFDAYLKTSKLKPAGHVVYADHGTETLDAHYAPYADGFAAIMARRGWKRDDGFYTYTFPGTTHTEQAWNDRFENPLLYMMQPQGVSGAVYRYQLFPSALVKPRQVTVWLPNGYDPAKRYKVVYMMDGQNLFDPSPYANADWGVESALSQLITSGQVPPAIVVGIDNIPERNAEYTPQRIYELLPPDYQSRVRDFMNGSTPNSDNFLKFLVTELKPFIDKTYPTIAGPEGTSIIGSSSGGHIALYAQGQYPQVFGASASLSMPWIMNDMAKDPAQIAADDAILTAAYRKWLDGTGMKPGPNRIYSDQGTAGLDALFTPYEQSAAAMFRSQGWNEPYFTAPIYDGAQHSEKDWRKRVAVPLKFVLAP